MINVKETDRPPGSEGPREAAQGTSPDVATAASRRTGVSRSLAMSVVTGVLLGALTPIACLGQPDAIAPAALQVVESMGTFLESQPNRRFTAQVTYDEVLESGQLAAVSERHDVVARLPHMMRATVLGRDGAFAVMLADGRMTVVDGIGNRYAEMDSAGNVPEAVDQLAEELGLSFPGADFLYPNPARGIMALVSSGEYLGVALVQGEPCHHLALRQPGLDWQLWVAVGPYPTPQRVSLIYTSVEHAPRFTATLDWELSSLPFPEDSFRYVPAGDARRVASVAALTAGDQR